MSEPIGTRAYCADCMMWKVPSENAPAVWGRCAMQVPEWIAVNKQPCAKEETCLFFQRKEETR